MELIPEAITYRYRLIEDQFIVWISQINRYLRLEEPAFHVFKAYLAGVSDNELSADIVETYGITSREAFRFISEIQESLSLLFRDSPASYDPIIPMSNLSSENDPFSVRYMEIYGKTIGFCFESKVLEDRIFPLFAHLESIHSTPRPDLYIELGRTGTLFSMVINKQEAFGWPRTDFHKLMGAMSMQILNCIYQTKEEDWMGVVHASSVSLGTNSLLFPAQPGGGKSTLAALMMANGCGLIADDFTPLSVKNCHSHFYPASISVKPGSLQLLGQYFPNLKNPDKISSIDETEQIKYLTPQLPTLNEEEGFPISAIVFIEYIPGDSFELIRIPNFDAINDLFDETWLSANVISAEKFLDWFFQIPCYRMQYGNHELAVESLLKLLKDES